MNAPATESRLHKVRSLWLRVNPAIRALLWLVTGATLATAAILDERPSRYRGQPMVLRTYSVAPALEVPLRQALQYALEKQGRIIETGAGARLLIAAPQSIHDQIPELLGSLGNPGGKSATLQFEAWYLVATQGAANLDDPSLRQVRTALQQVVEVDGPQLFEVVQRKAVRVQVGADAEASPLTVRAPRLVRRRDRSEVVAAELQLQGVAPFMSWLKTQVELTPGETLVIGQTTLRDAQGQRLQTLYQIVRVSL